MEKIEDLPGWKGSLSRIDAEKILTGKPTGTYLLRAGDEVAISSSFHFAEENLLSILPFILSLVEQEDKISDLLLLHTNKGWIQYHDDPDLKDPSYHYFPSLAELLYNFKGRARTPLT